MKKIDAKACGKKFFADNMVRIDDCKKQEALEKINSVVSGLELEPAVSDITVLCGHFRYMDKTRLFVNLAANVFLAVFLVKADIFVKNNMELLSLAVMCSILLGVFANLSLGGILSSKGAELSMSCYFGVRQMAAVELLLNAAVNLIAFGVLIPFLGRRCQMGVLKVCLYLFVPYFISLYGCLSILLTEAGRRKPWILAAAGIGMAAAGRIAAAFPFLYEAAATGYWLAVLVLFVLLFAFNLARMFRAIREGALLCMD